MYDQLVSIITEIARDLAKSDDAKIEESTPLLGEEGVLDSVQLVTLVVEVEQAIDDQMEVSVSLADEKAMSQRNSPFRTVASLAAYAQAEIESAKRNG